MRESIGLYRILAIVFSCICIVLLYMNYNLLKSSYSVNASTYILKDKKIEIKKYGYTDILNILKNDGYFDILSIGSKGENEKLVSFELKYNSSIYNFINTLEKIKLEESFVSAQNIKVQKIDNESQSICFTATFLIGE